MTGTRSLAEFIDAATAWAALDPDPASRAELDAMIAAADPALEELFTGRIAFGTAGLRAAMGPGPNRMNRLVVQQTTAGLMSWLEPRPLVVIGYDARHQSAQFARDTAAQVAMAGGRAELLPGPLPTPVLAHAVLARSADAGVMITASHNPPADNGYKLYLSDGIQLVSPADGEIAAAIDRVATDWTSDHNVPDRSVLDGVTWLGDEIAEGHLEAIQPLLDPAGPRTVSTVYTAMHGVGGEHFMRAMERAGFPAPAVVPEQFAPDPDFPTAAFPNPEEAGALDLAMALAQEVGAAGVIAHDPDADRLALAVPGRDGASFVRLTGDQVGSLLADHLLSGSSRDDRPLVVAKSLVSSRLLERIAAAHGAECVTTLTGFKWVARPIVEQPEARYVLGYEEALGYCVGGIVRDKDGISAGLVAAEMLAGFVAEGTTVWDQLDRLAVAHGAHLTGPVTIRRDGPDGIAELGTIMSSLVAAPPSALGGSALSSFEDLSDGAHFQPTPGLVWLFDDESRVIIRPSGTEPKLKAYVEVIEPVTDAADLEHGNARAAERLGRYQDQLREMLN